jgi:hypothetical protein
MGRIYSTHSKMRNESTISKGEASRESSVHSGISEHRWENIIETCLNGYEDWTSTELAQDSVQ